MKIYKKFMWIIIIVTIIFTMFVNNSYAKDPLTDPDFYKPSGDLTASGSKLIDKGNIIIGAMQVIGTVVSIISIMVIGLKYMMGSTEEKASYKETMIPYIIGAVMLFAIPNLLSILYDLVSSIKY